jgi:uncharacterized protein
MDLTSEWIRQAEKYVQQELGSDASGHDWQHIERVRKWAVHIAEHENADVFVCEMAALLHDVADAKLNPSKEAGLRKVSDWLEDHRVDIAIGEQVMEIISTMSYNSGQNPPMRTIEGKVVQDADRLDALGAIGIARTFAYSGWKGRLIHHPDQSDTAIAHFYDKLLKLKDLMNTSYAKELAQPRHAFLEAYLEQFYREWDPDGL